jgi:transcription elongation factor S-II
MFKIDKPDQFRQNVRAKLDTIVNVSDHKISINLEKAIYNYTIKEATQRKILKKWDNSLFAQIYIDRLRTIYINLKNTALLEQLRSGDITPMNLAFMTHQEMNPDQWREIIDKKIQRDASKYTNNIQASTDMFTCRKCKSKKCTYYELQTRSADEPATIFVTCLDCGKNWKS